MEAQLIEPQALSDPTEANCGLPPHQSEVRPEWDAYEIWRVHVKAVRARGTGS